METKHTPGPLEVARTGMLDDYPDGPFLWAVKVADPDDRDVHETALVVCSGDISEDEAEANGRLYAAAPELLAACEHAAVSYHHPACKAKGEYSSRPDLYCTCHVQKARAAIARATGAAK